MQQVSGQHSPFIRTWILHVDKDFRDRIQAVMYEFSPRSCCLTHEIFLFWFFCLFCSILLSPLTIRNIQVPMKLVFLAPKTYWLFYVTIWSIIEPAWALSPFGLAFLLCSYIPTQYENQTGLPVIQPIFPKFKKKACLETHFEVTTVTRTLKYGVQRTIIYLLKNFSAQPPSGHRQYSSHCIFTFIFYYLYVILLSLQLTVNQGFFFNPQQKVESQLDEQATPNRVLICQISKSYQNWASQFNRFWKFCSGLLSVNWEIKLGQC